MQKNFSAIYTYTVILSLLTAPIIRLVGVLAGIGFLNILFIAIVCFALGIIAFDSFSGKNYAIAFDYKNQFHLDRYSYIAAAGFFFNFLTQCVLFFGALMSGSYNMTYLLPIVMSGIGAIVSSVYFIIVGFSFGEKSYDFREFRLIHILPILWSISCIFNLIEISSGFEKDTDSFLKYLMMILLALFFYFFASEVDSSKGAKMPTVFLARAYSYVSILYFFDRLILILSRKVPLIGAENAFAITCVMIASFTFFFEKNILSKSGRTEN